MKGILKVKIEKTGDVRPDWKWNATAPNGEIMTSGRGFNTWRGAKKSIKRLLKYFCSGKYVIEVVK